MPECMRAIQTKRVKQMKKILCPPTLPCTRGKRKRTHWGGGGCTDKPTDVSKPYAASGNYINRMSDYCKSCSYQVKLKTGEQACPFNALYWHFIDRNRDTLAANPRMAQMYRTWDRMADDKRVETISSAQAFLDRL